MAWGSPTIHRIVVGIRTNLTQQVSTGPREGDHQQRGDISFRDNHLFFFLKLNLCVELSTVDRMFINYSLLDNLLYKIKIEIYLRR